MFTIYINVRQFKMPKTKTCRFEDTLIFAFIENTEILGLYIFFAKEETWRCGTNMPLKIPKYKEKYKNTIFCSYQQILSWALFHIHVFCFNVSENI